MFTSLEKYEQAYVVIWGDREHQQTAHEPLTVAAGGSSFVR